MSAREVREVFEKVKPEETGLTGAEKSVLVYFAFRYNEKNGAFPSQELAAEETGYTDTFIRKTLRKLRHLGFLKVVGRKPGGTFIFDIDLGPETMEEARRKSGRLFKYRSDRAEKEKERKAENAGAEEWDEERNGKVIRADFGS